MSVQALYNSLAANEAQKAAYEAENQNCREKIAQLQATYDGLREAKQEMQAEKKQLENLAAAKPKLWRGELFRKKFAAPLQGVVVDILYANSIKIIDSNMAEVNNKIAYYNNILYSNQGVIGAIMASIGSLWSQILNWVD